MLVGVSNLEGSYAHKTMLLSLSPARFVHDESKKVKSEAEHYGNNVNQ